MMAKTTKQDLVAVRLSCFYSGFPGEPGPGSVIQVDATEAARLVSIGAAEVVK